MLALVLTDAPASVPCRATLLWGVLILACLGCASEAFSLTDPAVLAVTLINTTSISLDEAEVRPRDLELIVLDLPEDVYTGGDASEPVVKSHTLGALGLKTVSEVFENNFHLLLKVRVCLPFESQDCTIPDIIEQEIFPFTVTIKNFYGEFVLEGEVLLLP